MRKYLPWRTSGCGPRPSAAWVATRFSASADELLADAQAVAEAGAFGIVLECIPRELAARITEQSPIPTIGIGAGPHCDGQVLVLHDFLGILESDHQLKFVRQYADLGSQIRTAVAKYVADVSEGRFPAERESFR